MRELSVDIVSKSFKVRDYHIIMNEFCMISNWGLNLNHLHIVLNQSERLVKFSVGSFWDSADQSPTTCIS